MVTGGTPRRTWGIKKLGRFQDDQRLEADPVRSDM
jgi:hypothetical protein